VGGGIGLNWDEGNKREDEKRGREVGEGRMMIK
jgi:hypothetical protein